MIAVCSNSRILDDSRSVCTLHFEVDEALTCAVSPVAELYDGVFILWIVRVNRTVGHGNIYILILCVGIIIRDNSFSYASTPAPIVFVTGVGVNSLINVERLAHYLVIDRPLIHGCSRAIIRVEIASELDYG